MIAAKRGADGFYDSHGSVVVAGRHKHVEALLEYFVEKVFDRGFPVAARDADNSKIRAGAEDLQRVIEIPPTNGSLYGRVYYIGKEKKRGGQRIFQKHYSIVCADAAEKPCRGACRRAEQRICHRHALDSCGIYKRGLCAFFRQLRKGKQQNCRKSDRVEDHRFGRSEFHNGISGKAHQRQYK